MITDEKPLVPPRDLVSLRFRLLGYVVVTLAAVGAIVVSSAHLSDAISPLVQAVATIALAVVGIEAVLANRRLVDAARLQAQAATEEAEAARLEAKATTDAVEATRASTTEARRQAMLGSIPYLRAARATPFRSDVDGALSISIQVANLGPGHALEIVTGLEVRYGDSTSPWVGAPTVRRGRSEPLIIEGQDGHIIVKADELRNASAEWPEQRWSIPTNAFVPRAIRITIYWLSTLGATAQQSYVWQTRTSACTPTLRGSSNR